MQRMIRLPRASSRVSARLDAAAPHMRRVSGRGPPQGRLDRPPPQGTVTRPQRRGSTKHTGQAVRRRPPAHTTGGGGDLIAGSMAAFQTARYFKVPIIPVMRRELSLVTCQAPVHL